jgi:hypothetical protein
MDNKVKEALKYNPKMAQKVFLAPTDCKAAHIEKTWR